MQTPHATAGPRGGIPGISSLYAMFKSLFLLFDRRYLSAENLLEWKSVKQPQPKPAGRAISTAATGFYTPPITRTLNNSTAISDDELSLSIIR